MQINRVETKSSEVNGGHIRSLTVSGGEQMSEEVRLV